jgi:dienelactone hydrolase
MDTSKPTRGRPTVYIFLTILVAVVLAATAVSCGEGGRDSAESRALSPASSASSSPAPVATGAEKPRFSRVKGVTTASSLPSFNDTFRLWRNKVPAIRDVRIASTSDGSGQAALWLPPAGEGQPLLVVLHSWSAAYLQHLGVPFARWAQKHGWAMIAPNFRGVNDKAQATGSDLAVQDVVDAVRWSSAKADIDSDRVFVIGFSGGGMMSLLMAGRHPGLFAGAVAWVPIHDLVDWYRYTARQRPQPHYVGHIRASCGGDPRSDKRAGTQCAKRSPRAHLPAARKAGVPVYIGHGLSDQGVRPDHTIRAFNQLAARDDRIPPKAVSVIRRNVLPKPLRGSVQTQTHFGQKDPRVVFARTSGPVTVVLFEGEHDMVYHPGLRWMWEIAGTTPSTN